MVDVLYPLVRSLIGRIESMVTPDNCISNVLTQVAFATHLKTTPGIILTPQLRLGIAIYARDALLKCNDEALSSGVCPVRLYDFIDGVNYEPSTFPVPPTSYNDADESIKACLMNIIHAMINWQSKLDTEWYLDCINTLLSCGILDNYIEHNDCGDDKKELELASHAVFSEIIILTSASHGIHTTFLALGTDIPPLPTWEDIEEAPEPLNIRYSSLLHRVRRNKESISEVSPYFTKRDLNRSSPEYHGLKEVIEQMTFAPLPYICVQFAFHDSIMLDKMLSTFYLSPVEMALHWNELDTSKRCSSVMRSDVETLAGK